MRDLEKIKFDYLDMFNMNYAEATSRLELAKKIEALRDEDPEVYQLSSAPITALILRALASENLMHMRALLAVAKEDTAVDRMNKMIKHD